MPKSSQKKHYVCQHPGCDNRCNGKCDAMDIFLCYGGNYDGSAIFSTCEKCERGTCIIQSGSYKCKKCGHTYCYDCCFT